jgi:hypothetical protein
MVSRKEAFVVVGRTWNGHAIVLGGVLLAFVTLRSPAAGQAVALPLRPVLYGQWAGPYELPIDLWGDPQQQYCTAEIVHMAVLPPSKTPGSSPATSVHQQRRVLFVCRTGGYKTTQTVSCNPWKTVCEFHCPPPTAPDQIWGRAYKWMPGDPESVSAVALPASYPQNGSQDFFCGGHTFLRNGNLLFANGTDKVLGCAGPPPQAPYGSTGAWRLDTSKDPPEWVTTTATSMPSPRWYPTLLELGDGRIVDLGHEGYPNSPPPDEYRDELTLNPALDGTWSSGIPNRTFAPSCPTSGPLLTLYDYPRVHLLAGGELIWTTAVLDTDPLPGPLNETWVPRRSQFLDVTPHFGCSESRWKAGTAGSVTLGVHLDGSSVHLITWDITTGFKELLYAIGGALTGIEAVDGQDTSCTAVGAAGIHGIVERMVLDPLALASETGEWVHDPALDLNLPRANHNAVLLLDGSILVVGGVGSDDGINCAWRLNAERLMPPEVIGSTTPTPWEIQAAEQIPRQYHSVAGLLPDGRVVSAGGVNLPESEAEVEYCVPDHTVEIYTPNYTFRGGVKPVIDWTLLTDPAAGHYNYGDSFPISVTLDTTAAFDRVALVRPGASTHAFDSSQLYVELPVLVPPLGGGPVQVNASMPPNANYAPPGDYLLVVIDNAGRPSAGEWLRLDELGAP